MLPELLEKGLYMDNYCSNISEFERTKPVETMKALNSLIQRVKQDVSTEGNHSGFWSGEIQDIFNSLLDIKTKLKRGE